MPYNPLIPQPGDLLSDSQKDILDNFSQANTTMGINHYPFTDPTANNGKHKVVEMIVQPDPIAKIGEGQAYSKVAGIGSDAQLFWRFANGGLLPLQITGPQYLASTNGYVPLMNGMLLQWGRVSKPGAISGTVLFATANVNFSNLYGVFFTLGRNASATDSIWINTVGTTDNTQFAWKSSTALGSAGDFFYWVAIGS